MEKHKGEGHRKRLRERFVKSGLKGFLDYEILELLLTYAISIKDTKQIAKALINKFQSFSGTFNAEIEELRKIKGIGEQTSVFLKLIRDVITKYFEVNTQGELASFTSKALRDYLRALYHGKRNEIFKAFYFSGKNIIHEEDFGEGTINEAAAFPRKIVESSLKHRAISVLLVHNHPTESVEPSERDIEFTKTIVSALDLVDVKLTDHLIVSANQIYSFRDNGLLGLEICG